MFYFLLRSWPKTFFLKTYIIKRRRVYCRTLNTNVEIQMPHILGRTVRFTIQRYYIVGKKFISFVVGNTLLPPVPTAISYMLTDTFRKHSPRCFWAIDSTAFYVFTQLAAYVTIRHHWPILRTTLPGTIWLACIDNAVNVNIKCLLPRSARRIREDINVNDLQRKTIK